MLPESPLTKAADTEYKKGTTDAAEAYEIAELRMERSEGKASLKSLVCLMIWLQNG